MSSGAIGCTEFRDLIVDDDPEARRQAQRHAEQCEACAAVLRAHEAIAEQVEQWRAATPAPPSLLESRVLDAIRAQRATDAETRVAEHQPEPDGRVIRWRRPAAWPRPVWAAAGALAATLAIGSMLLARSMVAVPGPERAERLLVADALRDAEAAEREHARAIAQLEQTVAPILAAADDPDVPGSRAARLMSFRNRLRFLEETIAEIDDFANGNPGHSGARTMLLAAYVEKTEVLREVIAFAQESGS